MIFGTIRAMGRNRIDIYDENTRTVRSFIYLDNSPGYQTGDRVRIDYTRDNNVIQSIKKMTALDYSRTGQNLGYILHNTGPADHSKP